MSTDKSILFLTILFYCAYSCVNCARILAVIPTPSFSHQIFFRPLWRELTNRGHELTLITTDPMESRPNLRQIDVSMVYDNSEKHFDRLLSLRGQTIGELNFMVDYFINATRRELLHPEIQELFNNKSTEFDLLMLEHIMPLTNVFKYRFDVPFIGISSFDAPSFVHEHMGNPVHALLYSDILMPHHKEPSFLQRINLFFTQSTATLFFHYSLMPRIDSVVKETLNLDPETDRNYPGLLELGKRMDMMFINVNPVFNSNRPTCGATISLSGGMHIDHDTNPMSPDVLTFLNSATNGFIYFSLGSNVKSKLLPKNLQRTLMQTFAQLPYKVLWKFELDSLPDKPDNVMIKKWVPQQQILKHKNLKLFINQGGMQSLEEALLAGVPIITMPFFGDQGANSARVVANELGLSLSYPDLTIEHFNATIFQVISNKDYRNNAMQKAKYVVDMPINPLDNAVWWTEYVLRHKGAKHLKGPVLPLYQFYYLDIIACAMLVFLASFLVIRRMIRFLVSYFSFRQVCEIACNNNNVKKRNDVEIRNKKIN